MSKSAAEWVRIGGLLPWERNPKAHPVENVAEIARSIVRFGFTEPIVAWKSRKQVVAGHGRLLAAEMLYREDPGRKLATDQPGEAAEQAADGLVPVRWIEFTNDREAAAYAVADNRLTEKNPMAPDLVAEIFHDLDQHGVSLDGLGYSEEELAELMEPPAAPTAFGQTPEDVADAFADSNIKRVTLVYGKDDYVEVIELLDSALKVLGASDYSSLIFELLRRHASN